MTTYWYIEPKADLTNEMLAAELARESLTEAETECVIVIDGKPLRVYNVPYRFITLLERSEAHRKLFRAYVYESGGKPRPWNLQGKRRGARTAKSVRLARRTLKDKTTG